MSSLLQRKIEDLFKTFIKAVCLIICLSWRVSAQTQIGFKELKAQFVSLRNTDVDLVRAGEWEHLAKRFEEFVEGNRNDKFAPEALFDAAILYENLFRKFGGSDRLKESVEFFEKVAKEYPGDALADDALTRKGDLLFKSGQIKEAEKAYTEVVEAYPSSDYYQAALVGLDRLRGNKRNEVSVIKSTPKDDSSVSKNTNKPLIVIDPGHGGEDFGSEGGSGLLEKDVTLDIATRLEKLLEGNNQVTVRLTRRTDSFVPLAERTAISNDYEADIFVSLHTNASPKGDVSGLETYYLDTSGDESSKKLAERENKSVAFEGTNGDLQYMLSDLIQNAKLDDSILLAHSIQDSVISGITTSWGNVHSLGVKKALFYVLVGAHMPCVLVEMFFINHAEDGRRLADPKFRQDLALSLYNGIIQYLTKNRS